MSLLGEARGKVHTEVTAADLRGMAIGLVVVAGLIAYCVSDTSESALQNDRELGSAIFLLVLLLGFCGVVAVSVGMFIALDWIDQDRQSRVDAFIAGDWRGLFRPPSFLRPGAVSNLPDSTIIKVLAANEGDDDKLWAILDLPKSSWGRLVAHPQCGSSARVFLLLSNNTEKSRASAQAPWPILPLRSTRDILASADPEIRAVVARVPEVPRSILIHAAIGDRSSSVRAVILDRLTTALTGEEAHLLSKSVAAEVRLYAVASSKLSRTRVLLLFGFDPEPEVRGAAKDAHYHNYAESEIRLLLRSPHNAVRWQVVHPGAILSRKLLLCCAVFDPDARIRSSAFWRLAPLRRAEAILLLGSEYRDMREMASTVWGLSPAPRVLLRKSWIVWRVAVLCWLTPRVGRGL